ncbi:MAG: phosphatidylserine/phosphatidylglycerophosphate/cardiolipin synthase family protein [Candidatus Phytoplasma sp.]|nr:phosphatidylserine/phosphatidylglycerophosphate/cardiolipin synthase family protein [Phytoplasma sp.]
MQLLINGKEAFKEICHQIDHATSSIEIQMFIWRDDFIGNTLLKHLLDAANRGVKIKIKKDLYGAIFEKGEETRQSLFHKKTPFSISFSSWIISNIAYYHKESPRFVKQKENNLVTKFISHPNVEVSTQLIKDHTKYYIFDQETLIIGGINIEDKEYEKDLQNRHYQDYMVKLKNQEAITFFLKRLNGKKNFDSTNNIDYIMNTKLKKEALTEILNLISTSKEKIHMAMAYFGNKQITKALINAQKRGVDIRIITSAKSNIQPHLNLKVLKKLQENDITVYLHEGLIHAKAMLIDDKLIIGSINLNDNGLKKLSECSIYLKEPTMIKAFSKDLLRLQEESIKPLKKDLKYCALMAFFEQNV